MLSTPAMAARQTALSFPEKVQIPITTQTPLAETIRLSIIKAASQDGWFVQQDRPNRMEVRFNKGSKHELVIAIPYDANGYKFEYVSSINLNYNHTNGIEYIHPNANRWVANLNQTIYRMVGLTLSTANTIGSLNSPLQNSPNNE